MPTARDHGAYQIGEIARRTHLSLRTLRYWEEVGLVTPSGRTVGGFRLYSEADLARVMLVRDMKAADFTIDELKDLVDLVDAVEGEATSAADRTVASQRLEERISGIRSRCEVMRGRILAAEAAALELERMLEPMDGLDAPKAP